MEKGNYILWLCTGKLKRVRKASCPDFFLSYTYQYIEEI